MAPITMFLIMCLVKKSYRSFLLSGVLMLTISFTVWQLIFINSDILLVSAPYCLNGNFTIYGPSLSAFLLPRSAKVVYFGKLNEKDVVIKKIKGKWNQDKEPLIDFYLELKELMQFRQEEFQSLMLCPTTDGIADLIQENVLKDLNQMDPKFISEPLLLQVLKAEDGWQVPKFFGRCGDEIVEEYIGSMLSHVNFDSWAVRAAISKDLLRLADQFTFKHKNFSFYFTDWSPDNLAVNDNKVYMIDLENVIIVDRRESSINETLQKVWNDIHISEIFEDDFFAFSSADVCSHKYSDHNFYAVCAHLLARSDILYRGLLEDVPEEMAIQYPTLTELLHECTRPQKFPNRIDAGRELLKVLEAITKNHQ